MAIASEDDDPRPSRWWPALLAIALLAGVVRVAYVLVVARHLPLGSDATWYLLQRGSLFDGAGFSDPEARFTTGALVPTANFPPLYPVFLVAVRVVGGDSETVAQLAGAVTGMVSVVLTGLVGRRFGGAAVGLVAAAIVAVNPMLIAADGSLMSEVIYVPLVLLATLLSADAGRRGGWWRWIGLGVVCGLCALTRQEALLLVPLLVLPVLWWSTLPWRRRLLGAGVAVLTVLAVIAPWVVRNQRDLGEATISTASPATSLAGANCERTYGGPSIGSWEFSCTRPEDRMRLGEVAWGRELRGEATTYAREHASRLVFVLPARELRVWGVWDPRDLVPRDAEETRSTRFQWLVWSVGMVTLVAGAAGLYLLRERGRILVVLLGPVLMVGLTALASHGNPRFRTVAEPILAIGGARVLLCIGTLRRWVQRAVS